jgi:hypothetical protein
VKPTIAIGPFGSSTHAFAVEASLVESRAVYATTPPGQEAQLGVELDLAARYRIEPAFEVDLSYGVLFPGAGFRNVELGLDPHPAQALEVILAWLI